MGKQIIIAFLYIGIGALAWYADGRVSFPYLSQISASMLVIAVLYVAFRILLITFGSRRIKDAKSAYRYRKTLNIVFYLIVMLGLLRIWVLNPQALIVSYGIIAAGAAIALQDVIKNIAGGIIIVLNNLYRAGDRIQVENTYGDVIDIGLFNTTMLEIRNWVGGDQPTGRIISLPNGALLSKAVTNYTRDHEYLWDEAMVPITYDSEWKTASKLFLKTVNALTEEHAKRAEQQFKRLARRYYYTERNVGAAIYITPTDNWLEMRIRYISAAHERRETANAVMVALLNIIEKNPSIRIASSTFQIVGLPPVDIRMQKSSS